jgi:hypothetical protein
MRKPSRDSPGASSCSECRSFGEPGQQRSREGGSLAAELARGAGTLSLGSLPSAYVSHTQQRGGGQADDVVCSHDVLGEVGRRARLAREAVER